MIFFILFMHIINVKYVFFISIMHISNVKSYAHRFGCSNLTPNEK